MPLLFFSLGVYYSVLQSTYILRKSTCGLFREINHFLSYFKKCNNLRVSSNWSLTAFSFVCLTMFKYLSIHISHIYNELNFFIKGNSPFCIKYVRKDIGWLWVFQRYSFLQWNHTQNCQQHRENVSWFSGVITEFSLCHTQVFLREVKWLWYLVYAWHNNVIIM